MGLVLQPGDRVTYVGSVRSWAGRTGTVQTPSSHTAPGMKLVLLDGNRKPSRLSSLYLVPIEDQ